MKALALLASFIAHAGVCGALVLFEAGSPKPDRPEKPEAVEPTMVELIELPPVAPVVSAKPSPLQPPTPEPPPSAAPDPPPSRPAPSAPAKRPQPRPAASQAASSPPPATDASASGQDGSAETPAPTGARRLDVTMSNATAPRTGRGAAGSRGTPKAPTPGCSETPSKPKPIRKPTIGYSAAARSAGLEGRLVLRASVDRTGRVSAVQVLQSVGPSLDTAAVATFKRWTFEPARACGRAVAAKFTIARNFKLGA